LKRIFLTGPIGCGKSTLIKNVLGDSLDVAGGFLTKRIPEQGELEGFDIVSPAVCEDPRRSSGVRFLTFCKDGAKRNNDAFSGFAAGLIREAIEKPFAVIDEIGGYELLIPEFMEAFEEFLASPVPCLGVLKALPSSEKLSETIGLSTEYLKVAQRFHLRLLAEAETEILETFGRGDENTRRRLKHWKEKYATTKRDISI